MGEPMCAAGRFECYGRGARPRAGTTDGAREYGNRELGNGTGDGVPGVVDGRARRSGYGAGERSLVAGAVRAVQADPPAGPGTGRPSGTAARRNLAPRA